MRLEMCCSLRYRPGGAFEASNSAGIPTADVGFPRVMARLAERRSGTEDLEKQAASERSGSVTAVCSFDQFCFAVIECSKMLRGWFCCTAKKLRGKRLATTRLNFWIAS